MDSSTKPSNHQKPSLRLSDIHKLISGRYDGPCRTADAERYLMAAIPGLMPGARTWRYAVAWARKWTPIILEERGEDFVRDCWTKVTTRKRPNLTTDELAELLAVADDEPVRLNLRCIPAASRTADIRAADRRTKRQLAAAARRATKPGYTPRSESLKARAPWKALGMSRTDWYAERKAERLALVGEPKIPILDDCEAIVSVTPLGRISGHRIPLDPLQPISGPGDTQDVAPANDNPPPLTKVGYHGRHVTFTAAWVDILVSAAPHIADDLVAHLDAVDALMAKTPERNHRAVSLNLCRDRSRMVVRSRRKASSALAA